MKNLQELFAWLKANPNTASQGTGGSGSGSHVIGIYFQSRTGTQYQFVPYRQGTAGQTQDLLSGQIHMMFDQPSNAVQHVRSGRIKALCGAGQGSPGDGARDSDGGRGRSAGTLRLHAGTGFGRPRARRRTSS